MSSAVATPPAASPAEASRAPRRSGPSRKEVVAALGYLAPSFVGVVLFLAVPVVVVIVLSFLRWNLLTPPTWAGVSNYVNIFKYDGVGHSLLVTLYYVVLNIPVQTVLALGLAMLLKRKLPGAGFVRVVAVLPFLATPVAMAVVWNWFFDPATGVVNTLLGYVGVSGPAWLSSSVWAMPVVAFANVWQYTGYNMLFFFAGLQSIPASLYEASALDGASKAQQFYRLTLPLLRPTFLFVLVTGVIGSFQVFDTVYVLTNGGPGNATEVMNSLIYKTAFVGFRIGDAAAMSVVLFVVILSVTILQFSYFRNRTTYEMS